MGIFARKNIELALKKEQKRPKNPKKSKKSEKSPKKPLQFCLAGCIIRTVQIKFKKEPLMPLITLSNRKGVAQQKTGKSMKDQRGTYKRFFELTS